MSQIEDFVATLPVVEYQDLRNGDIVVFHYTTPVGQDSEWKQQRNHVSYIITRAPELDRGVYAVRSKCTIPDASTIILSKSASNRTIYLVHRDGEE